MSKQGHRTVELEIEDLHPRQIDRLEWLVLSERNDNITVQRVDLEELTCTCKDKAFNRESREPCAHIVQALLSMDTALDAQDYADAHLTSLVDRAHRAVEEIEGLEDGNPSEGPAPASEDRPEPKIGESSPDVGEPSKADVDVVNTWLDRNFAQPEKVDVELAAHAGQEGVKLSPDNQNMQDHIYESFKNLVNSVDGSGVHVGFGDDPCHECGQQDGEFYYHLNRSGLQEVLDHHG
jgi:hypothetical protein